MPSIVTHHIFSEEVYNNLSKKIQKKIDKSHTIYNVFAQSHDYLFYSKFNIKKGKEMDELGHYAHKHNTQEYLINLVNNIKELKLENDSDALGYLFGSVTHYVLDSTCHPFIFYKGGAWNKDDIKTYKYRGEHNHIEKELDAIYYEKYYKKNFKYCNITKEIIKNPIFTDNLNLLINKTYKDTYNKDNVAYYYYKGIQYCKRISSIIIKDRFGIKRMFYSLIDLLTLKLLGTAKYYSTHLKKNTKWLNLEHKEWNNPVNPKLIYTYSFEDLYEISLKKAIIIIDKLNQYLDNEINIKELKKYIPDVSYSNGLLIKDYAPMRYFEY
ncbi:MAG: zinc dependent phospholipase C family protein [Candidatus Coprovivens sp.]